MEEIKQTINTSKRALTNRITSLKRYMVENRKVEQITSKVSELKVSFDNYETLIENYFKLLRDAEDENLDDYEQKFDEILNSYISVLEMANSYTSVKQLNDPPIKQELNISSLAYLPKVEIEIFTGEPTKYHTFKAIFCEAVERHCVDGGVRLTRILQYTDGIAKQAIRACAIIGGQTGYDKAWEILEKRFGNKHIITESLISQLKGGKYAHTKQEIQALADDLNSSVVILTEMNRLSEINTQSTLINIVDKLPRYIQNRWGKEALIYKKNQQYVS